MKWINIEDQLPVIPRNRYGIQVLVVTYDSVYEEISGNGYEVIAMSYGRVPWSDKPDFYDYAEDTRYPPGDPVKYWMYFPKFPLN